MMLKSKILMSTIICCSITTALAGTNRGVYVELQGGKFYRNLENTYFAKLSDLSTRYFQFISFPDPWVPNFTGRNTKSSWTIGGDIGYRINKYFSIELGYFKPSKQSKNRLYSQTATLGGMIVGYNHLYLKDSVSSWLAYTSLKGQLRLINGLNLFAKLGATYVANQIEYSSSSSNLDLIYSGKTNFNKWLPIFGAGLSYSFTGNFSLSLQYLYVPTARSKAAALKDTTDQRAPFRGQPIQLLTFGLGYLFNI